MNTYKKPISYTITMAKQDIDNISVRISELERENMQLRADVDQYMRDEWRALRLVKILTRRLDILEEALLLLTGCDGKKYLSHDIINKLKNE